MGNSDNLTYEFIRADIVEEYATKIGKKIGEAACLETLAEECSELAQAALKKARKIRGENPTPKTMEKINENLIEEISDVQVCLYMLSLHGDLDIMKSKLDRCKERLKEKEIKPCPFCGGESENIVKEFCNSDSYEKIEYTAHVECCQCGAEGPIFEIICKYDDPDYLSQELKKLKEQALEAWNNRGE